MSIKNGELFERELSKKLHQKHTPVLISSKLLRRLGCGQVDVSYVAAGAIILVEAKSSLIGVVSMKKSQVRRLLRTARLLQNLLDLSVNIKIIAKRH